MINKIVKNKDKLVKLFGFLSEYSQDLWCFIRHNGYSPFEEKNKRLFYKIIIEVHTIEKGLSLAQPKPLFGQSKIIQVMNLVNSYDVRYSPMPVEMTLGAFSAYINYHRDIKVDDPILQKIDEFIKLKNSQSKLIESGGVKFVNKLPADIGNFSIVDFLLSRSSCRMFKPDILNTNLVESIIEIAQSAPSQCNRQSAKIHFYQSPEKIKALLALQGGSRGFADTVSNLFVVTADVAAWGGPGQRNQLYVDGSLFAMSVLLACHAKGVGTCPLNLAVGNAVERSIRAEGNIPSGERLIMMIAIGLPVEDGLRAAKSPRRNLSEILRLHGA